jgi:hypothetical protein
MDAVGVKAVASATHATTNCCIVFVISDLPEIICQGKPAHQVVHQIRFTRFFISLFWQLSVLIVLVRPAM